MTPHNNITDFSPLNNWQHHLRHDTTSQHLTCTDTNQPYDNWSDTTSHPQLISHNITSLCHPELISYNIISHCVCCGRRSTQSLQKELRRAVSLLDPCSVSHCVRVAGAVRSCGSQQHVTPHTIHFTLISHHSSHNPRLTLLISYHSSHTTHHTTNHLIPLISYHSSHTTHLTALLTQYVSHITHLTPLITQSLISHHSSHNTHHTTAYLTSLIAHRSSHTTHLTPFISHHSSYTTHLTLPIRHHAWHTTHLTAFIAHYSSTTLLTPLVSYQSFDHHLSHTKLIPSWKTQNFICGVIRSSYFQCFLMLRLQRSLSGLLPLVVPQCLCHRHVTLVDARNHRFWKVSVSSACFRDLSFP